MKKVISIIILFALIFYSCKSQNNNIVEYKENISFPTGFQSHGSFSGMFYQDNEPYFYFGELISRKIIKVFNKDANLVKEISLKNQEYLNLAANMYMPSMDSVIVTFGHPVQKVLVTNSKGETIFEKYFKQFIRTDSIDYALDSPFALNTAFYHNSVYLFNNGFKQLSYDMTQEQYVAIQRLANKTPMICQIELDNQDKEPIYFGDNFAKRIYDNDSIATFHFPKFKVENNYLFYVIKGYGKILVVNLNNNEIFKILDIKHKNKRLGIEQRKFKNYESYSKDEEDSEKNGSIFNVVWDKFREVYYILICEGEREKYKRKCFIQIFDKEFKFRKEIEIGDKNDAYLFDCKNVIVLDKGLLIKYNTSDSKSMVYRLYNINL